MINMFNNKYPYTDFHELNLDWLLESYQEIVDNVNDLFNWMATHKVEYQEALARLTAVENEIDTFEQQITDAFDQLKEDQEKAFAEMTAQMITTMDAKIADFDRIMKQALADFEAQFKQLKINVEKEITALKLDVQNAIVYLNTTLAENNKFMFEYIENRLDEFIRDFPSLVNIPVYNPVRGMITTLQKCLVDLYDMSRFYALTAFQYDSLNLTAEEYDNMQITAMDYDQQGYILLGYPDDNFYMINPFTGVYEKIKDVIYYLATLHMDALTADEYDIKELTADEYDALLITAYQYDVMGKAIII